jgi:hypothetical protein
MARPRNILKKQPVLVSCEGGSENGYVGFLGKIAFINSIPVFFKTMDVKGGSPSMQVDQTKRKLDGMNSLPTSTKKYLLLDTENYAFKSPELTTARTAAREANINLIWRNPCNESFMLHHFEGYQNKTYRPSTLAKRELRKIWPRYEKGMDARQYLSVITMEHIQIARSVEPDFDAFLTDIGWK